jgi:hypothetical protein
LHRLHAEGSARGERSWVMGARVSSVVSAAAGRESRCRRERMAERGGGRMERRASNWSVRRWAGEVCGVSSMMVELEKQVHLQKLGGAG